MFNVEPPSLVAVLDGLFGRTNRAVLSRAMNGPLNNVPHQLLGLAIQSGNTDDLSVTVVELTEPEQPDNKPDMQERLPEATQQRRTTPVPSYAGDNLVNLVAELELRLTGQSPTAVLRSDLASLIPDRRNCVLVVIDGLGDLQLAHPNADRLRRCHRATLTAPFPTTTTVGLSPIATGMTPMQHGAIGYTQWIPSLNRVMNMLQWSPVSGLGRVDYDPARYLPTSNLWERLNNHGVRTVIVQPAIHLHSRFSNMLSRGAERHGYTSPSDIPG